MRESRPIATVDLVARFVCQSVCHVRACVPAVKTDQRILSGHVTRLKLSMGPIRGPYSLHPRHVRASMLPKKRLILIQCISNDITEIYLKMTMSHWKRIMNEDTHLLLIPKIKMPQNTKISIWQPRWNMISPVIFVGALTIFAGALPPWAPPW